jgi:hypothetical protein
MSAQKSILSFFGARVTPSPLPPPAKAAEATPPTVSSGSSATSLPPKHHPQLTAPVTPIALGQKFSAPASPGIPFITAPTALFTCSRSFS